MLYRTPAEEVEGLRVKETLLVNEQSSHLGREHDEIEKDLAVVRETIRGLQSMRGGAAMDWSPVRDGKHALAHWRSRPPLENLTAVRGR
jgi:hypothetical protein